MLRFGDQPIRKGLAIEIKSTDREGQNHPSYIKQPVKEAYIMRTRRTKIIQTSE